MIAGAQSGRLDDGTALLGRVLLVAIFLHEAVAKVTAYAATVAYSEAHGVPGLVLPAVIAVEAGGGLAILLGYRARCAALLLAGFCVATALLFHTRFGDGNQLLHFEKNLAIAGGFLMLWLHGPGRWSLTGLPGGRS